MRLTSLFDKISKSQDNIQYGSTTLINGEARLKAVAEFQGEYQAVQPSKRQDAALRKGDTGGGLVCDGLTPDMSRLKL